MSSPISRLSPPVILTGVRRQPNGVEGPHHRHALREVSGFFSSNRGHKGRPKKWLALLEMTIGTDDSAKRALRGTEVRPCVPARVTTVTYQNVPAS